MAARVTQELVNMRGQLQGKEEELLQHKQEGRATNLINYTLYSRSVFSLAKSLQMILEISATYRLVSHPPADY